MSYRDLCPENQRILRSSRLDDANTDAALTASRGRVTEPTPLGSHVGLMHDRIEDDPLKGFKDHRDFLSAVVDAGRGERWATGLNYLKAQAAVGSDEHSTFSDRYGGFFVPESLTPDFLKVDAEPDPMGAATMKVPMSTVEIHVNARTDKNHNTSVTGGLVVGRSAESVAKTASRMSIERVTLRANGLFGLAYATEELLTDSPRSFIALLDAGFRDEITSTLIDERLNGTGANQFTGIVNAPCTIAVPIESGQAADTIVYENVVNMRSRCWGYSKAMWIANHDTTPQLMQMAVQVGVGGGTVWQESARVDRPNILLGRPLVFSEYAATLGDVGDIVLCNWSQYLEGLYQPLRSAESIHVRFVNHERAFKFWLRNDGAPWWRVPLTPKNSSVTMSPFLTLAERA